MLKKVVIKNYKVFRSFALDLNPGVNVIVGDNDAGKSKSAGGDQPRPDRPVAQQSDRSGAVAVPREPASHP
jgi:hypothetical protein